MINRRVTEFEHRYGLSIEQDRLGGRIPINNMCSNAKEGRLSVTELNEQFELLINNLYKAREVALNLIEKSSNCKHEEFNKATYTLQKRILNYVYVYERCCSNCGYKESFQLNEEDKNTVLPDWAKNASERYYNDSIF